MKTKLSAVYDTFATTYEENRGLFDMSDILESFYAQLSPEQGRLLDLGCGAGEPVARYFTDQSWSVIGVDFSEKMLELASHYVPQMQTIQADISEVEFEPGLFDAITASYSLFHLPAAKHAGLFRRMHSWLRPQGKALFTYATQEYTGAKEFEGYKEFMGQQLYYSHKEPTALYADLERIGFSIDAADYRRIGGETFLWVTVGKHPV
ncbi:27-O-demethylrifamycin SV methyltransferase [Halioglobus japonicus]|nr:27-O-demethylrifamycin SV methyltransferase [Halioglobus japonicus]